MALHSSLGQKLIVIPIVVDQVELPLYWKSIPYVDFRNDEEYDKKVAHLIHMLSRAVLQSGNLLIANFTKWGHIDVDPIDNYSVKVNSNSRMVGASGLVYDAPLYITGFQILRLQINNSAKCEFTGYSILVPKMLKIQIDDKPIHPRKRSLSASDDTTYLAPTDGEIDYLIPKPIRQKGSMNKFEIVFGAGTIRNFCVRCLLV